MAAKPSRSTLATLVSRTTKDGNACLRRATLDDYEGILSMGTDLFGGFDYLPAQWPRMLTDPTYHALVLEFNGKITGYSGIHILENGKVGFGRGGRLHPAIQGQGNLNLLMEMLPMAILKIDPRVDVVNLTWKNNDPVLETQGFKHIYKKYFERKFVAYKFPRQASTSQPATSTVMPSHEVTQVSQVAMETIIKNKELSNSLFPEGFILARFIYLKPTPENLKPLFHLKPTVLGSISDSDPRSCRFLTIGIHYPCWAGYALHIECFGEDTAELASHVVSQFQVVSKLTASDLYVHVYGKDPELYKELLRHDMVQLGGEEHKFSHDGYVAACRNYEEYHSRL